ncbi:MMPL family transporter, partial [Akkermansiaceae bacterium]|nr:MMPL family transporter [Akkermansiaceae bacterium]
MSSIFARIRFFLPLLLLLILAAVGIRGVKLDKELIAIFPQEEEKVLLMKEVKSRFEHGGRLIIQIDAKTASTDLTEAASSLNEALRNSDLCSSILYKPLWESPSLEEKKALSELLAYFWINGEPEQFAELLEKTSPSHLISNLEEAQQEIAFTFDPEQLSVLSRDPLGLTQVAGLTENSATNPFLSKDGKSHLMILYPKDQSLSQGVWFSSIQQVVKGWQKAWKQSAPDIETHAVGASAYAHEIASNVKKDVIVAVVISSILSGIIFWFLVRNHSLIRWKVLCIASVLLITFGIGSLILGRITLMSAGFASILIGLATDYGMLICTEALQAGGCKKALFKKVYKSILFATFTTSLVFASLCLSSLPGVIELGTFVSLGIIFSCFILLRYFLPLAAKASLHKSARTKNTQIDNKVNMPQDSPLMRKTQLGLILLSIFSIFLSLSLGIPEIKFDLRAMSSAKGSAELSLQHLKQTFPEKYAIPQSELLIKSSSNAKMQQSLSEILSNPSNTATSPLPLQLTFPNQAYQQHNKATFLESSITSKQVVETMQSLGFQGDSTRIANSVFSSLESYASSSQLTYPTNPIILNYLNTFISLDNDGSKKHTGGAVVM